MTTHMNGKSTAAVDVPVVSHRPMKILVAILILDLVAFAVILPLFPSLLEYYEQHDATDALYVRTRTLIRRVAELTGAPERVDAVLVGGALGSVFSALQFVSSPMFGALSDVFGRRRTLLVATLGTLLSYVLWYNATTFTVFVASRLVGGLCKASVSIAIATATDLYTPDKRGPAMALIGVCFSVGFLIGPMVGAYFASYARTVVATQHYYFTSPALFAIGVTVIELVLIVTMLPETLPEHMRKQRLMDVLRKAMDYVNPIAIFNYRPLSSVLSTSSMHKVTSLGSIYFVYLLLYAGLEFTLSFHTHTRFNYDNMQQGRMYFYSGLIMIFVQGGYIRRLAVTRQLTAALCGIAALIPAYCLIAVARTQFVFYAGMTLYAFASAAVVPCLTTVSSNEASAATRGTLTGVLRSQGALARALGPCAAAVLYWTLGSTIFYMAGACALIIPLYMLKRVRDTEIKHDHMKQS